MVRTAAPAIVVGYHDPATGGERQRGGHHLYDGKIVAVGLGNLREHGPAGPVFLRFGRDDMEPLLEAIGNPPRDAADAREAEETRARQLEYQAQVRRAAQEQAVKQAAELEARRPVCTGCGAKFTDARWEAVQPKDWGASKDSHPQLCDGCKQQAAAVVAGPGTRERQEPAHREVDPLNQKSAGWLARLRR
ncbi:hypothetical protein AB0E78_40035 [Streptomyces sp. NPDC032198]|uniref:hypothetical protein n=1 Tax=Streptomyces sp. NPDC032198 TaxID=3155127 RepID=UPI0033E7769D